MTFALVRIGWPNAAAVLALAAVPLIALLQPAKPPQPQFKIAEIVEPVETPAVAIAGASQE